MPHKTWRSSSRGRPGRSRRRGTTTGNNGSIRAHNSSDTIHGGCCPFLTTAINNPDDQHNPRSILLGVVSPQIYWHLVAPWHRFPGDTKDRIRAVAVGGPLTPVLKALPHIDAMG